MSRRPSGGRHAVIRGVNSILARIRSTVDLSYVEVLGIGEGDLNSNIITRMRHFRQAGTMT